MRFPRIKLPRADLHALSGAYAVDAIDDPAERDRFERHMHRCQQCAAEVRDLTATATRLAFAASRPPPPELRSHVLTAVAETRQLSPTVELGRARARHAGRSQTGRAALIPFGFAAGCAAVAIVLLIVLISSRNQLDQVRARNTAITSVLSAPDSRSVTYPTSAGGHMTIVYSLRRHAMIFTSRGLPAPPPGKVYELWLIGPPRVRPAGLLGAGQTGRAGPIVTTGVTRGDRFGMTVEPAGGTSTPTTPSIIVIPLRS
jgi:anti-sigma-K factor RskA